MKRSLTIIMVSAASRSLQLLANTLSDADAVAKPLDSIMSLSTPPVELPWRYHPARQPPPNT